MVQTSMRPIETSYRGRRFRSRLEARWAVLFDALYVDWEYEKEGFEFDDGARYLPDFWLPRQRAWIDVKGSGPTDRERLLARSLADASEHAVLLVGSLDAVVPEYAIGEIFLPHQVDLSDPLPAVIDICETCCVVNVGVSVGSERRRCLRCESCSRSPAARAIVDALNAARGARFEHGECGALFRAIRWADGEIR